MITRCLRLSRLNTAHTRTKKGTKRAAIKRMAPSRVQNQKKKRTEVRKKRRKIRPVSYTHLDVYKRQMYSRVSVVRGNYDHTNLELPKTRAR